MSILSDRAMGLNNWKHRRIGGFHKTVHLEEVTYGPGATEFRKGTPSTTFSVKIDPIPIVRLVSEDDISVVGGNVSLSDSVFEISGSQFTEAQLRSANQLTLNKGKSDVEHMQILSIRPSGWREHSETETDLSIMSGRVIRWKIFARATKTAI